MHESGLIEDLIAKAESVAQGNGGGRVVVIEVAIGALSGFEPDHLREHFAIAAAGTLAEGAELRIRVCDDPLDPDAQAVLLEAVEVSED